MAKDKISQYSTTNALNTDIGGIDIDENCLPSNLNNGIREVMVQLKEFQDGSSGDSFSTAALSYTGTLTGGTGVINIGSGQVFKDASGNLGIGTSSPARKLHVIGASGAVASFPTTVGVLDALVLENNGNANTSLVGSVGSESAIRFLESGDTTMSGGINYSHATNYMYFTTDNAERLRIDSSGSVGINTSSPSETLDVNGTIQGGFITSTGSIFATTGIFRSSDGTATIPSIQPGLDNDTGFFRAASNTIGFSTGGQERARIDSSGNLLVGTTSATNSTNTFFRSSGAIQTNESGSTASQFQIIFANPNGNVGNISSSGTTTSYNTSSDYRLKNIEGAVTNSGKYIDSLKPVHGSWKADGSKFIGLIAHEAQEVSQTPVATGKKNGDEMQGMDYSNPEFIANIIAELQSLRIRVAQLEGN